MNRRARGVLATAVLVFLAASCGGAAEAQNLAGKLPLSTLRNVPEIFGTKDFGVITISATQFVPDSDDVGFGVPAYFTSPGLGRYCQPGTGTHYYAALDVPAGAIIDFVGLNTSSDTDAVYGVALYRRSKGAFIGTITAFSAPAHAAWDTDYAGPIGYRVDSHQDAAFVIDVEQAASPNYQYFGWVEVWYRRTVSDPPATATFNDVPVSHPFFQFVEALSASGITGGCGNGNYCPDAPLTRGQMAVFLAKALGLHWPG
jgi:S-layer family protein